MLSYEEISQLSDDPELAFLEYEKSMREWLEKKERDSGNEEWEARKTYFNCVRAFHDAKSLTLLSQYSEHNDGFSSSLYYNFVNDLEYLTVRLMVEQAGRQKAVATTLQLSQEYKKEIRVYIEKIKETVEAIELPIKKKDKIYKRINALANEVDCEWTKSDALMALTLEVADTGGEAAKKLKPVKDLVDSVTSMFAEAKEATENLLLSGPEKPKQIEHLSNQENEEGEKNNANQNDNEDKKNVA